MSTHAAEFFNATKVYQVGLLRREERRAVTGVSFTVPAGKVFALLGPNRAGKTTLVKLLLSLARPTGGEVKRLGQPIRDRSTLARVGYVHENHAFPKYLTATALLEYYGTLTLLTTEQLTKRIPALLERVGLADRARDPIRTFSKGMTQRLGIAQALLNEPDLLVLDEPTEGLDLNGRKLMAEIVREWREQGRTVIVVSHVLREIEPLCDQLAVIVGGKLAHLGPVSSLTQQNGHARSLEDVLFELYARPVS